ncbi:MAG: hypothetical protein V4469_02755 [Patescibacteria group bacterium]
MNKKTKTLIFLSTAFALIVTLSDVVSSWTPPTTSAPGGDTTPPINEGGDIQKKAGNLGVNGLASFGGATFTGKVQIKNGTQGEGKILVSDATGNVKWVTPPEYDPNGLCPTGTIKRSDGQCGYSYTLTSAGYFYCSPGDDRTSWYDSGQGRNHTAGPLEPNGCYAFEGRHNNGGPGCTMTCVGAVKMCVKMVNGDAEWYLSGPDKLCNK